MTRRPTFDELHTPRPYDEWDAYYDVVLWWLLPIDEPPYLGHPDCSDWPFTEEHYGSLYWTPLPDCDLIQERYTHAEVDRLRASVDAVRLVDSKKTERLM